MLFLGQHEPDDIEENRKFKDITIKVLNNFKEYFEENEIPKLKQSLKLEFQKKYHLIDE